MAINVVLVTLGIILNFQFAVIKLFRPVMYAVQVLAIFQIIRHVATGKYQMGKSAVEALHTILIQDKYAVIQHYNGEILVVVIILIIQKHKYAVIIRL